MEKRLVIVGVLLTLVAVSVSQKPMPSQMLPATPMPDTVETALFEEAVECIKQFEGWHGPGHYPYVGYGHKLLPGETFGSDISRQTGDSLLRADLLQKCAVFRRFGKDSLLLGVLAYNVGEYRLLGIGRKPKSELIRKLENGDRNILQEYVSFRMYNGKVVPSIERRRRTEHELLFDKTHLQITFSEI